MGWVILLILRLLKIEVAFSGADTEEVSNQAKERGRDQLRYSWCRKHFLEVQVVDEIYDETAARAFGLELGQVTVMLHSGSRGLGHQVCTDFLW